MDFSGHQAAARAMESMQDKSIKVCACVKEEGGDMHASLFFFFFLCASIHLCRYDQHSFTTQVVIMC